MNKLKTYTIGTLAKETEVGIQTIRFYERKGLLKQPQRGSGYRQYTTDQSKQIRFIKRAQELGFTLKEVKGLLDLEASTKSTCAPVQKRAQMKITEVKEKIEDLERMLRSLKKISNCCAKGQTTSETCRMEDCFSGNC